MEPNELREELLILSAKREIKYKENYIKKANEKTPMRIHEEYQQQQLLETNEMLTDLVIGKFAELLESLGWIDSALKTGRKLQEKKMFRQDVNSLVSKVSPYIPFVGILEGGICVAEDVAEKQMTSKAEKEKQEEPKKVSKKEKPAQKPEEPKVSKAE